ncbi:MAG: hypothetical protein ACT4OS_12165 [Acidimicrobiales bacterium]
MSRSPSGRLAAGVGVVVLLMGLLAAGSILALPMMVNFGDDPLVRLSPLDTGPSAARREATCPRPGAPDDPLSLVGLARDRACSEELAYRQAAAGAVAAFFGAGGLLVVAARRRAAGR